MSHRKAFTLIELLVSIAIIVVLLSLLMPGLKGIMEYASLANCLQNMRLLAYAWTDYATENDEFIVNGFVYGSPGGHWDSDDRPVVNSWVGKPVDLDNLHWYSLNGAPSPPEEHAKDGVRLGKMYPYEKDIGAYHCPGDQRTTNQEYPIWVSYSIVASLNAQRWPGDCITQLIKKRTSIRYPEEKMVFVEEADPRNYNAGGWGIHMFDCPNNPDSFGDRMASFHGNKGNMSFVDGHAETRKWQDPDTIEFFENIYFTGFLTDPGNVDLLWLQRHFPLLSR